MWSLRLPASRSKYCSFLALCTFCTCLYYVVCSTYCTAVKLDLLGHNSWAACQSHTEWQIYYCFILHSLTHSSVDLSSVWVTETLTLSLSISRSFSVHVFWLLWFSCSCDICNEMLQVWVGLLIVSPLAFIPFAHVLIVFAVYTCTSYKVDCGSFGGFSSSLDLCQPWYWMEASVGILASKYALSLSRVSPCRWEGVCDRGHGSGHHATGPGEALRGWERPVATDDFHADATVRSRALRTRKQTLRHG